jgi:hypothetical protein
MVLASEAESQNRTPAAHVIERRELVGHMAGIVHRQHHHRDGEANPRRHCGRVREDQRGIEAEDVVERVLGHPQVAESECFGTLRNVTNRRHVDRIG